MRRAEEVQGLVGAARIALRKGRKEDAREKLRAALALDANDANAIETLGDLCLEDGEHERAIIAFEKGRKLYPEIGAFEEKIGLAKLDLQEMRDDAILRQRVLEHGDDETWQDVSPSKVVAYSLLLPGAGHFAIEENERGAAFLGAAIFSFVSWSLPLYFAMNGAGQIAKQSGSVISAYSAAIAAMNPAVKMWFWLMLIVWQAIYIVSAWDGARCAKQARINRKRALGLEA
jgi:tetratricopeptide (TPR) repeat protein